MGASGNVVRALLGVALLLAVSGCLEHNITTIVREDGSCERLIIVPADSFQVPSTPYPLSPGLDWDTTWRPAPSGRGQVLSLRRKFASVDELPTAYAVPRDSEHLDISFSVTKKFRWFYTYYEYREVFHRLTAFTGLPPEAVLNEDEIARYTRGERNDALNRKVEEWIARCLYEALFVRLRAGFAALDDPELPVERFEAAKQELFGRLIRISSDGRLRDLDRVLAEQTSFRGRSDTLFNGKWITEDGLSAFLEVLAEVMGKPRVSRIRNSARTAWEDWADTVERSARLSGVFVSSVELPGVIVRTNSPLTEGNTLTWKFDGEQYGVSDFVMEAESRVENFWAFGLTGAIALLIAAYALFGRRRPA